MVALVLGVIEVIALINPSGTKMADDGDPFGPPAPWQVHVIWLAVVALLIISAVVLLRSRKERRGNA